MAALALAVSPVWWSQATIAEVYTLHVALALLIVWLALRLAAASGRGSRWRLPAGLPGWRSPSASG